MDHSDSFTLAVIIPGAQAAVTGLWVFLFGLSVCALAGLEWWYAAIGAGLSGLAAWVYFWSWWSRIIQAEVYPYAPPPAQTQAEPEEPQTVKVIVSENQGRDTSIIDLPASRDQLQALADGIEAGQNMSLGAWTGPGNVFTRQQWEKLRGVMISRGLAAWNNPHAFNQGFSLTVAGVHLIKRIKSPTRNSH